MKKVFIIGIGAGNPDYITVQAIKRILRNGQGTGEKRPGAPSKIDMRTLHQEQVVQNYRDS
jgi:hypothetical protein